MSEARHRLDRCSTLVIETSMAADIPRLPTAAPRAGRLGADAAIITQAQRAPCAAP